MSWNYRVVRKDNQLEIHGVYYDESENIIGIDEDPNFPFGEDLEELENRLYLMTEALKREIIDFDTFTKIK